MDECRNNRNNERPKLTGRKSNTLITSDQLLLLAPLLCGKASLSESSNHDASQSTPTQTDRLAHAVSTTGR